MDDGLVPDPIRSHTNDFARYTMTERIPGIITRVLQTNPALGAAMQEDLARLRDYLLQDRPLPDLDPAISPDADAWSEAVIEQSALASPPTWRNTEWFFGETYFYRYLMQVVDWFGTYRDPFGSIKQQALAEAALWELLAELLDMGDDLDLLSQAALWGNRLDLSHAAAGRGTAARDEDLLVDERPAFLKYFERHPPATVIIVLDNTGPELASDLVLTRALLGRVGVERVILHAKVHPAFVSDAIPADVWQMLAHCEARGAPFAGLAADLENAWQHRRLQITAHPFWNSNHFFDRAPPLLLHALQTAGLVIFKGDFNYRRLLYDTLWPPNTPFAELAPEMNLLALRTLKSDPVVGLPAARVAQLDAAEPDWRTGGQYGVIQFAARRVTPESPA